ncbi:MAG: hypothetical protein ACD_73C00681G0001 [uncultured bacterium]|nr:MAG: hypothetical protein ACD_73C00681G0001 [uncultured bacterium]
MGLSRIVKFFSGGTTTQAEPLDQEPRPAGAVPADLFSLAQPTRAQKLVNSVVGGVSSWLARPTNEMQLRLWRPHLERNKANINHLADQFMAQWKQSGQTTRPKALVLGVGDAYDIDLAHLSRFFDLILVDIKEGVGNQALKSIPYGQRGASKGVQYDLTNGIIAKLLREGVEAIKANQPTEAIVDAAIEQSRTGVDQNPFGPVDFVVSSMLMSQLGQMPLGFLRDVAQQLGRSMEKYEDLHWFDTFSKKAVLQGALIKRHVDLLKKFVLEGAWVYAATDIVLKEPTHHSIVDHSFVFDVRGAPYIELTDLIVGDEVMQVQALDTWEWNIESDTKLEVQALAMVPVGIPMIRPLPAATF